MGSFSPRPATVGWFDITASDPAHTKQFYQEVFSWEFASIGDDYHTITAPGAGAAMGARGPRGPRRGGVGLGGYGHPGPEPPRG
ncbi:hypothetical protein [Nocardia brasiliensis]|uniref:hypothetical protein n=1 Tax=Nocardia brasiliensis TaxID=37326 RepID=UPI002455FCF2|nr:hypothetical protein [Nocardia brasiliensis]